MIKLFIIYLLILTGGGTVMDSENDRAVELDSLMNVFYEYDLFNGVILAAEEDEIIYYSAFGKANFEWEISNQTDTRFKMASITKVYTASLILHLVERGMLSLDDVITDHLPDYPSSAGDRITLEHLLVQSAGIPDYINLPGFLSTQAKLTHDKHEFVDYFAHLDLEFEPGTDWNYGNSGYYLLGLIVEEVTGMSYEDAMEQYILEPLGLDDTGYAATGKVIERLAGGYVKTPEGYEKASFFHSSAGFSAGMMYATAEDMFRWTRALAEGKIIRNPYHLQNMVTPQMEDYGFGMFIGEQQIGDRNELVFSHSGNVNGFTSQLSYFSDSDYTLIIMDNTQQCASRIFFAVREVLFGEQAPVIRQPIANKAGRMIKEEGVEQAVNFFREHTEGGGQEIDFSLRELTRLSNYYLERNEIETAIPILEFIAEFFPGNRQIQQKLLNAYKEAGKLPESYEAKDLIDISRTQSGN